MDSMDTQVDQVSLKCPLCRGRSEWEVFRHYSSFATPFTLKTLHASLIKCSGCGLICLYPRPTSEMLARVYNERYLEEQNLHSHPLYDRVSNLFLWVYKVAICLRKGGALGRLVSRLIWPLVRSLSSVFCIPVIESEHGEGPKVLDVGCSTGKAMRLLDGVGWDVYGIDVNKDAVAKASTLFPSKVSLGRAEEMHWPDDEFDLVRASHVLEHTGDPIGSLIEMRRILKKGGRLLLSVPNVRSLETLLFGAKWHAWDFPHLWHFSGRTIKKMLIAAGFDPSMCRVSTTSTGFGVSLHKASRDLTGFCAPLLRAAARVYDTLPIRCLLFPIEQSISAIGLGNTIVVSAYKSKDP